MNKHLYRILDANFNRTKEGLRVCEDICRYVWNDKWMTRAFKDLRHQVTTVMGSLSLSKALASRDINSDIGRSTSASESKRRDIAAVFGANMQRVKESLRVLEEVAKLEDISCADQIKQLRYRSYALEQKIIKKR